MTAAPKTPPPPTSIGREPWTVRVAIWSAKHRWLVLGFWFLLTIGLFGGSMLAGGQRSQSIMGGNREPIGESVKGWRAFDDASGEKASKVDTESFYLIVSNPKGKLDTPDNRNAIAAMTSRLAGLKTPAGTDVFYKDPGSELPAVVDPYVLAGAAPKQAADVLSADGTTAIITANIAGNGSEATEKANSIKPVAAEFKAAYPSLKIYAFNNRLINDDFGKYVNSSLDALLLPTLLVTFLILIVAFRAVVAAVVPLVLAVTAILGAMGLVGLYSQTVSPVSQYAVQIVVLIGLAVAVDYSLFVISRFRTERGRNHSKLFSIETASSTAGRAVFFSGLAVMISLGGLLLINDETFKSIAVGAISVVLVSVLGSLTFLPAVLSILDRKVNRLGLPILSRDRGEGRGIWGSIVRVATNRPVIACVATAVIVLVTASPVRLLQLGSTTDDVTTLPSSVEGVQAWKLISDKWPGGRDLTIEVIVTNAKAPATQDAIARYTAAAAAGDLPVKGTPRVSTSGDGTVASLAISIPGGPNDMSNWDRVREFRTNVVPGYFGGLASTNVYVSGEAAYILDYANWYGGQMPVVMLFVLGMSFLLLLVAFHSIVIPIKAIVLNLMSAGAAFGVLVLLFQEGWLREFTGIRPVVVEAWAPAMIFTILFGLSMDYEVFILTRVKEAKDRGLSSTDAVVKGITITSGTVTSAAAIMVCVFGAFFSIQLSVIQQLGIGLAVAVFVDATLIRSLLLPSTMKLLGDWNWWMPSFLRWIPRVTIEGEPEAALEAEEAAA